MSDYGYDAYRLVDGQWEQYEESISGLVTVATESDYSNLSMATSTVAGVVRLAASISSTDSGCPTASQVWTYIYNLGLSNYVTSTELTSELAEFYSKTETYSQTEVNALVSSFVTEDDVEGMIEDEMPDVSSYATQSYVTSAISAESLSTDTKLSTKMNASTTVSSIEVLTQDEYDALTTKLATTLYLIKPDDD